MADVMVVALVHLRVVQMADWMDFEKVDCLIV